MAERKYRSEVEWQALNVVNYGVNYNNGDTLQWHLLKRKEM